MTLRTRRDVSSVPLQGGYVAKRCPVRAQNDVLVPTEPRPVSDAVQRRFDLARDFEADVRARLITAHPEAVAVDVDSDSDERETATLHAMQARADLIVGGRLPADDTGRRAGEPDVLVHSDDAYVPVDIKWHKSLTTPGSSGALATRVGCLNDLRLEAAVEDDDIAARKKKKDLLQLAHYRRMLEACGMAATENRAGIIGTEERVVWYDLDAEIWRTPSVSEGTKLRSTMEVYDFEFGFRLDIIAAAQEHARDPAAPLLVVPVWINECNDCPWRDHCLEQLETIDDVSLIPQTGWNGWKRHRDRDVHTRADLAGLDRPTAELVADGIDVAAVLDAADGWAPNTPLAAIVDGRRQNQVERLAGAGIHTAGDCARLDPKTAAYSDIAPARLPHQIDLARAATAPEPVFLRRGVDGLDVPRGDIEIDIDLESTEAGVYLWGTLATDRTGSGIVIDGYRSFAAWEPLTPELEAKIFTELWDWLGDIRARAASAGHSVRIYCYHEWVEAGAMRRIADAGVEEAVDALVASDDWVDLLRVARDNLLSPDGYGLKRLARHAGFDWADDDAGGAQSMGWHDKAVTDPDPAVRAEYTERLLVYNHDDVAATKALREWLDAERDNIPRISDLDP